MEVARGGGPRSLGFGGGGHFALALDASLERGRSGPCATFLSPPLCALAGRAAEAPAEVVAAEAAAVTGAAPAGEARAPPPPPPPGRAGELASLGPDAPFRALDVEVWTFPPRARAGRVPDVDV